ncbi:MAG: hypothetical protein AAF423_02815 [Pseudomonadota bacterium]
MPHINRLVLNFPGFETTTAVHQIERLTAGGVKTAELWDFDLKPGKIDENAQSHKTTTSFESAGNAWTAKTRYVHFSWSDIIGKYEETPYPQSLLLHLPKYFSFVLDGSLRRYAKASRRYWGFTIYPILLMILFFGISFGLMYWLLAGFNIHWVLIAIPSFLLFIVLCKFPGDMFYVNLSVNDWAFARDMCSGANKDINDRFVQFADHIVKEISRSKPDEIIIVGHSFGSVWAVVALAIALEKKPKLFAGRRVTFFALGSSLLKIGLVRRAKFFKASVNQVLAQEYMLWHEIQTKTDFISFYKSDPFKPMKIEEPACDVIVHRVNFKHALSEKRHKKMLKSMYLAHRQYILYCDRRVHHDFQLRIFGPFFADDLARNTQIAFDSPLVNDGETAK